MKRRLHRARRTVSLPTSQGGTDYEGKSASAILTRASGFMDGYDFTLNPYAGCAFGCTYCYAAFFSRRSESKSGAKRRDEWGRWVEAKENAKALLEKKYSKEGSLNGERIYMSTVTDPYQPIEWDLGLTRDLLHIFARRHWPKLVVQTRSPDVVRDVDLFMEIGKRHTRDLFSQYQRGRVQVNLTVTTDDEDVRKAFEPSCPSNVHRLEAARELIRRGMDLDDEKGRPVLSTCVTMTPLLLVRDAQQFAADLLATGVRKFIIQPFHLRRGRFVAGTRDVALDKMAEKLGCERNRLADRYMAHYRDARDILRRELTRAGAHLGEGKEGFKPPF